MIARPIPQRAEWQILHEKAYFGGDTIWLLNVCLSQDVMCYGWNARWGSGNLALITRMANTRDFYRIYLKTGGAAQRNIYIF